MDNSFASRLLRHLQSMERLRIEDTLEAHGVSCVTLDSGVRVSATVSSEDSGNQESGDLDILVQATREGTRIEYERHPTYEDAAARYVELVDQYHKDRGLRAGTDAGPLCLLDTEPRTLSGAAVARLSDLADMVMDELELREKNDVLQTLFDNVPVLIILFDEDGHLQLLNRACERALGWTKEELAEHADPISLFYPDPGRRKEARSFIEGAAGDWQDFPVQRKDGSTALLRGNVTSLADGRRIGIGIDVSEEKERERRLRLLEAAVEHTRLPILITEAAPLDEPGPRIEYANPAVTDVTGYGAQEIQGRSPRVLQGPDTDPEALARIRAALEADEVTHYVSVQDDVTERVRRREELQAAKEDAEEANRIKAALLTNMNHEFRTPLTSIISFSQLTRVVSWR